MTPLRYQTCLDRLGITQRGLAPFLRCSDRLTREWATGRSEVPPGVAVWLESCLVMRAADPNAKLPIARDWRRREPRIVLFEGKRMALQRACRAAGIGGLNSIRYYANRYGLSWQDAFDRALAARRKRTTRETKRTPETVD